MNVDFDLVTRDVKARARALKFKFRERVDYDDMVQSGIEAALRAIPKVQDPSKAQAYVGKSACKGALRSALIQANGSIRNYRRSVEAQLIHEGKCVTCRGPQDADQGRECTTCKAKSVESVTRTRSNRLAAGLCILCGKEPIHRARMCKVHHKESCERDKRDRLERKARGQCSYCSDPARPKRTTCQRCADKKSKADKKSRTKHATKRTNDERANPRAGATHEALGNPAQRRAQGRGRMAGAHRGRTGRANIDDATGHRGQV